MSILYCDATLGVSGDMFLGALVDAGVPIDAIRSAVGALGIDQCALTSERVQRMGISATRVNVAVEEDHAHRRLADVVAVVEKARLDRWVADGARAVFGRIAEAEAAVHGKAVDEIYFHEVGALDAIVDVVGTLAGVRELAPDEIVASPIGTGSGKVDAAHGTLPVPAPATAELLKGARVTGGDLDGECATPTGVALVRYLAARQGGLPDMTVRAVGCGAGLRDARTHPNCLRLIVGETDDREADTVVVLETNIDDMPGEYVGPLYDELLEAGALDVYATSVMMKKNRPGWLLSVVGPPGVRRALEAILFRETTTIGIRRHLADRSKLARRIERVATRFGAIDVKVAALEGRTVTVTPEFDQCLEAARKHGAPVKEVCEAARIAFAQGGDTRD